MPPQERLTWTPTAALMLASDLSNDDDFLSHVLLDTVGTRSSLGVHHMNRRTRLPKHDPEDILRIIRKYVTRPNGKPAKTKILKAVDALLTLDFIYKYIGKKSQKKINAFATHASRYFELYLPTGCIEVASTSRYTWRTGKKELCILATSPLVPGQTITELKGSLADLTSEQDEELSKTGRGTTSGISRDFSVIHSKQKRCNQLFLGPARFVNHDCNPNAELVRAGRIITFRVLSPITVGGEVTAFYGDNYFGEDNCDCLCETCENAGSGGYGPQKSDNEEESADEPEQDVEQDDTAPEDAGPSTSQSSPTRRKSRGRAVLEVSATLSLEDTVAVEKSSAAGVIPKTTTPERSSTSASPSPGPPRRSHRIRQSLGAPEESKDDGPTKPESTNSTKTTASKSRSSRSSKADVKAEPIDGDEADDDDEAEDEEPEVPVPRVLRARRSLPKYHNFFKEARETPCSLDSEPRDLIKAKWKGKGKQKLAPGTCTTCWRVQPPILVDGVETIPTDDTCTRCDRHMAIFGRAWPSRVPLPGSYALDSSSDSESGSDSSSSSSEEEEVVDRGRRLHRKKSAGPVESKPLRPLDRASRQLRRESARVERERSESSLPPASTERATKRRKLDVPNKSAPVRKGKVKAKHDPLENTREGRARARELARETPEDKGPANSHTTESSKNGRSRKKGHKSHVLKPKHSKSILPQLTGLQPLPIRPGFYGLCPNPGYFALRRRDIHPTILPHSSDVEEGENEREEARKEEEEPGSPMRMSTMLQKVSVGPADGGDTGAGEESLDGMELASDSTDEEEEEERAPIDLESEDEEVSDSYDEESSLEDGEIIETLQVTGSSEIDAAHIDGVLLAPEDDRSSQDVEETASRIVSASTTSTPSMEDGSFSVDWNTRSPSSLDGLSVHSEGFSDLCAKENAPSADTVMHNGFDGDSDSESDSDSASALALIVSTEDQLDFFSTDEEDGEDDDMKSLKKSRPSLKLRPSLDDPDELIVTTLSETESMDISDDDLPVPCPSPQGQTYKTDARTFLQDGTDTPFYCRRSSPCTPRTMPKKRGWIDPHIMGQLDIPIDLEMAAAS